MKLPYILVTCIALGASIASLSAAPAKAQPAKFVSVEQRDGIWWFVDPEGQPFVSTGINHVEPQLILGPHNLSANYDKYGADLTHWHRVFNPEGSAAKKWIEEVKAHFDAWGVNTFAYHTSVPLSMVKDTHYFMPRIRSASLEAYNPMKQFLDPFTDDFAQRVDDAVRRNVELFGDEPNLLGYAYTDVPQFGIGRRGYNSWVQALQRQDAGTPGKQVWIDVLKKHYGTPEEACKVYPYSTYSWTGLAEFKEWKSYGANNEKQLRDETEFLLRIIEKWYQLHHDSVRRYDPHHLILGDKCGWRTMREAWPIIGKYVDVITIQWYATYDEQRELLAYIHEVTGKPILLGDSSFSVVKPYQDEAKGVLVESQDAVGDAYFEYMRDVMSVPYIVGWHFCGYMEGQRGMQSPDTHEDKQNGFLDPFGRPFEYTLQRVTEANRLAQDWHSAAKPISP